jgi:malonyl CoA-acyl carrier protein transacylase
MATAVLFPGQGSQQPDMRDRVAADAPDLLERCLDLVGTDPFPRAAESTRYAQPAIFCASVAGWRTLDDDVRADVVAVAGHSLGELAALVAAGALDAQAALELVVLRGNLMADAGEDALAGVSPASVRPGGETRGGGTMLALLGADEETAEALAHRHGVAVANLNAPGQVVLSGDADALDAAAAAARAHGVKALELGVAGAFHSPAMAPAVAPFAAALRDATFAEPAFPVISCATGEPMADPRTELAAALTRPVRWTATMRALHDLGADTFVDAGPGRVLAKLVKRNAPEAARA